MDLPKTTTDDHNKNNDDLELEMVSNHPKDNDSAKFKDSCELVDTAIEDATNNKNTLASTLDLVINLMKQVECQEKAAAQAKEEVATSGLDILAEVEQLKVKHQHIKETIDKHARNVYTHKAVLASEMTELQSRASSVLNEGSTSLAVLNKIREDLDKRMTSALEEKKLADTEKVEKELLARKALSYERGQAEKLVKELQRLKEEAANNSKLQQFLADRGHVIDMLDGDISEKCQDVKLLEESLKQAVSPCSQQSSMLVPSTTSSLTNEINEPADSHVGYVVVEKTSRVSPCGVVESADHEHVQASTKNPVESLNSMTSVVSPKHELLMSNMDLELPKINKNLTLGSDLENLHVVSDITQVGHVKSTEGSVALPESHNQEVALPSAIKSCRKKMIHIGARKKGMNCKTEDIVNGHRNHSAISRGARAPSSANESFGSYNDILCSER